MSRWVYAISGSKPVWNLGSPENITRAITENFGIGADSLDDSDLDMEMEEEGQDDLEDQNAAIIRFVNEVVQKPLLTGPLIFISNLIKIRYKFAIESMVSWCQFECLIIYDLCRCNHFQNKDYGGINISEKRRPQEDGLLLLMVRATWIFEFPLFLLFTERALV